MLGEERDHSLMACLRLITFCYQSGSLAFPGHLARPASWQALGRSMVGRPTSNGNRIHVEPTGGEAISA